MLRLVSCVWLQNYFFNFSNKNRKHRAVVLAAASQKKERRSHSCSILKTCYLALYLSLIKASADLEQKNSLKASQKGIHCVSRAGQVAIKVNFLHFFL